MKFFDDKSKIVTKWNRNYFYVGTIFLIAVNFIIFFVLKQDLHNIYNSSAAWGDFAPINILNAMFGAITHWDFDHVLGNMINLAVISIYLERKLGTFKYLYLNIILMFLCVGLTSHVRGDINHAGYSGVNFALYAFIIIDFIFSLKKDKRNLTNIILGVIVILYAYIFSMSWGGGGFIDVASYPYNLIHNMAHYTGFFVGILVGLFYQIVSYKPKNKT